MLCYTMLSYVRLLFNVLLCLRYIEMQKIKKAHKPLKAQHMFVHIASLYLKESIERVCLLYITFIVKCQHRVCVFK